MIGVIGLGGAGGNIAHEAQESGFLAGAINFSQKDLDAINVKHKLRLSGSEGVGKNRDDAVMLFQDQWEIAAKFVQEQFLNVEVLIFAFSSSGGSGSGIGPVMIDIMTNLMPNKVISAFVILPDFSEAVVSQMNCLKTFEELSRLNVSVFPIDNQQAKAHYSAKNKIFEFTNKKAIDLLKRVASYTDKHSMNGNFDKKDFATVLNTQGIGLISEISICDIGQNIKLTTEWVSNKIQESFAHSVYVPTEFFKVTRGAIIYDGQEELMEFINPEIIFSKFKNGMPIDLFEGYYHDCNGELYCILVGLGWCNKRLQDIEISLESNKNNIETAFTVPSAYRSGSSDLLGKLRSSKPPEKKASVMDILSKYKR